MSVAVHLPAKQHLQGRAEFLDSMRGLAALMVLYYHSSATSASLHQLPGRLEHLIEQTVVEYLDFGKVGVVLFFCISGFIIPMSFRSHVRPGLSFVVSRAFRLFPAYWLGLGLWLALAFVLGAHHERSTIMANFTMVEAIFGKEDLLKVSWTLFIEWIFYIFCFFAFLSGKLGQTRFSYWVATMTLVFSNLMGIIQFHTHRHFLPVGTLFALSLMIWASLWRNYQWTQDLKARNLAFIYLGAYLMSLPIVGFTVFNDGVGQHWYGFVAGYGSGVLLFLLFSTAWKTHNRWLVRIGAISYSLYLLHPTVIGLVQHFQRGNPWGVGHLFVLEVTILSIAAAALCYLWVEKPGIALGHRVRSALVQKCEGGL